MEKDTAMGEDGEVFEDKTGKEMMERKMEMTEGWNEMSQRWEDEEMVGEKATTTGRGQRASWRRTWK